MSRLSNNGESDEMLIAMNAITHAELSMSDAKRAVEEACRRLKHVINLSTKECDAKLEEIANSELGIELQERAEKLSEKQFEFDCKEEEIRNSELGFKRDSLVSKHWSMREQLDKLEAVQSRLAIS